MDQSIDRWKCYSHIVNHYYKLSLKHNITRAQALNCKLESEQVGTYQCYTIVLSYRASRTPNLILPIIKTVIVCIKC